MTMDEKISRGCHASSGKGTAGACTSHAHQEAGPENQALEHFDNAYLLWKAVTARYEQEMQRMAMGDKDAYMRIVPLVRDMTLAHHEFLKASQPLFHARP
jgi:hypothetical protein